MSPAPRPDRMEALTDGVFAIAATLLVLEVKVPRIPPGGGGAEVSAALLHAAPSLVAFAFGFLTLAIYWMNHDRIGKLVVRHDDRSRYLNLLLLFCICLVPFATAFIGEYPLERAAVLSYGVVMLACAAVSSWAFRHLAFRGRLLDEGVSDATRRSFARRILGGITLYAVAIAAGAVSVYAALALYFLIPVLYVAMPQPRLAEG